MSRFKFGPTLEGVDVMSRLKFGPQFAGVVVAAEVLPDVDVQAGVAAGRTVTVIVPAYDPAAAVPPIAVYACYLPGPPDPAMTAADVLGGMAPAMVGTAPVTGPGTVTVTVPGVPAGTYLVQVISEYAE